MKKLKALLFNEKNEYVLVLLMFLAGTAVYFFLGHFNKAISIYMDEIYYYDMARSIYKGNGFSINNFMPNFEKIAYPLFISPLFAITDGEARITVMSMLNSAAIVSSVFPVWLICRELGLSRKNRFIMLLLTVSFPDMMYSVTFMAENLYWPLLLWIIYVWLRNFKRPRIIYSIITAALSYIAYLCKEVALAIPIALVCFEIFFPIADHLLKGGSEDIRLKERFCLKRVACAMLSAVIFAVIFIVMKLTVFNCSTNSYQLSYNAHLLRDPLIWLFIVKAVLYYIAMLILSCFIIPFVYPLLKYRSLDHVNRAAFCFTVLFCLIITATITYTITIYEEQYSPILRSLLRYYGPLLLTGLAVFFRSLEAGSFSTGKKQIWIVLLAVTVVVCANFNGIVFGSVVDQSLLNWYSTLWVPLDCSDLPKPAGQIYMSISVLVVICMIMYLFSKKPQRKCEIFAVVLLLIFTGDNAIGYSQKRNVYEVSDEHISEVLAINEYFAQFPDEKSILFLDKKGFPGECARCMDTYFDYDRDLYFAEDTFIKNAEPGSIPFSEIELRYPTFLRPDFPAESFEYIIVQKNNVDMFKKKLANVELIEEISTNDLAVYKNNDIYSISFAAE